MILAGLASCFKNIYCGGIDAGEIKTNFKTAYNGGIDNGRINAYISGIDVPPLRIKHTHYVGDRPMLPMVIAMF